ncbi:ATP-dependent RNA helicase DDX24 [Thrips palmi]|uniref:RNA helicase n=1 Tax=Thrips palmi TaxID=161013 RepID=A0A6P8YZ06_THRPL|nr:ATP-dependent RNA helicase DDX24 [Thrips palmi]
MVKPRIIKGGKGQWKSISLDPTVFSAADLDGVIGIEELTDYSIINAKRSKKKNPTDINNASAKGEMSKEKKAKAKKKKLKKRKGEKHVKSPSNTEAQEPGEVPVETQSAEESNEFNSDDLSTRMAAWNGLGVPPILLRALAEKSFLAPTKIQALTLPAAIFGRRDILGAAETGSGKTLAFGLPILNGIIEELEKRKLENDVHLSDEEDMNSDNENFVNDDDEGDFDGNEHEANDFDEGTAEEDEDDDDKEDEESVDDEDDKKGEESVDDEEDEENNSLNGGDSDCEEYGDDFDSFDGTAQCVKVIDNITSGFPTVGESNSKTRYISKPLYALILTPTRELAVQISQHLKAAAKYTTISVSVVVGGLSSQKQERLLNRGPEIVVATPGRLWELIEEGHPHLAKVNTLKYLAIDETDRMLERGHFEELQKLLFRINEDEAHRKKRQNFIFSATLTLTHAPPRYVAQKKGKKKLKKPPSKLTPAQKLDNIMKTVGLSDPKIVDITEGSGVAEMLSEAQIICSLGEKDYYLYYFLQRHPGRTLVFCNSIEAVRRLSQLFTILGCSPWPLHAKMHQKARLKNLERFIASPNGVLLATDVAARGLDIPNVQHVIHYQIPRTAEGYVHRSGRTARAQQQGLTVVFIEPSEVINFKRLFRTLCRDPNLPMFPVESEWMANVKERVHLARRLDTLELQARRVNTEHGWLDKAVKEMDLVLSDDELPTSYSRDGGDKVKKEAAALRKQLNILLSKPLIPKGFSSKFPTQTGKLVVPLFPGAMSSNSEIYKETAVDALKQSVEDQKSEKRKRNNKRSKLNKRRKRLRMTEAAEEASNQESNEHSDQD